MSPDNASSQLHNGDVLAERYLIEELIGRGGMAEVYRGRDNRLRRPVALKVLLAHFSLDPGLRGRFEQEARAAALVSHPNVVAVFDAGEDDGRAFIVMELVAGETLFDRIGRGPVDAAFARSIGVQVLDALAAAHERGVLHRDIKPANVLITAEGEAKVADFGIAKAVHPYAGAGDHTSMNIVLGTPSYLAPERAQGRPATAASDLWSVGVLLYESVTGVKPFQGDNPIAITLAAQQARYVPVRERQPDIDQALASVIERAIDPDPAGRYSSADEMAAALRVPPPDATLMPGGGIDATRFLEPTTVIDPRSVAAELAGAGAGAAPAAPTPLLSPAEGTPIPAATRRRGRPGAAVLVGAAVAVLLGGILAFLLLGPGSSRGHPPTEGSRPPKGKRSRTSTSTLPQVTSTSAPTLPTSTSSTSLPGSTTSSTTSTTSSTTSTTSTTTTVPATTTTTTLPAVTTTTLPG
ncbi:MAG: serine/threonine-protein kinase [Acidimicrobiales bacterium]